MEKQVTSDVLSRKSLVEIRHGQWRRAGPRVWKRSAWGNWDSPVVVVDLKKFAVIHSTNRARPITRVGDSSSSSVVQNVNHLNLKL